MQSTEGVTDRLLVAVEPGHDGAELLDRIAGLRVSSAGESESGLVRPLEARDADGVFYPRVRVAVVRADADQEKRLREAADDPGSGVSSVDHERIVVAADA